MSPITNNLRHALTARVADWNIRWAHYGTNRRHTLFDTCLLFDAPISILVVGYILELVRIW
jgi:hypothetical protein